MVNAGQMVKTVVFGENDMIVFLLAFGGGVFAGFFENGLEVLLIIAFIKLVCITLFSSYFFTVRDDKFAFMGFIFLFIGWALGRLIHDSMSKDEED